jgi:hypothetical protein
LWSAAKDKHDDFATIVQQFGMITYKTWFTDKREAYNCFEDDIMRCMEVV